MVVTWRGGLLETQPVPWIVRHSAATVIEAPPAIHVRALGLRVLVLVLASLALAALLW